MIIPIRCFTCGKEISSKWEPYLELLKTDKREAEALDELGMKRICCRRMFLGHVDIVDKLLKFDIVKDFTQKS
ncbi:putative DNA-directed RNA polymerase [Encephalitozoon hellem]|uniref:DNA-directed RNA polymerases I, II, and III subunit RPABC5 n=1 Tax=Encephalitozoon hellem TaxID=27973 RepID=A0A9Q9C392_ENCHE|nr:DNA-directed RNA polymerase II subunit Rpb10 [Encephalitozoon hellem ATCC 50504]AFM98399.1 DNA-directed RNA polymerase II subunit Rpb10 [Encephalitozoon hellem ATCC 50504]KAG5860021.1 putative DNA-directed RNA polymerase [Encephalitozoon hellem]UTX43321.1 DNA-directed RNA polymerases I, II, and III subunit RPABC5 [Encephalitozoon hellem]WEL38783.1 DNA-directed RNA polymerase II subunit [Encephalitozoon hellem]|eukprot:XP_003887380.1 DNA-directed RNA polymerase II subunit Rpb10 [Encephalitozoon hellem ATCC 50504]